MVIYFILQRSGIGNDTFPTDSIPAITASFAPKYVHLQGWRLKFGQNVKLFQSKC